MTAMKEYLIKRGGVDLTVLLSDEDAKRTKARPVPAKVAPDADKAPVADSTADDEAAAAAEEKAKAEAEAQATADAKAAAPANKARAPQNK